MSDLAIKTVNNGTTTAASNVNVAAIKDAGRNVFAQNQNTTSANTNLTDNNTTIVKQRMNEIYKLLSKYNVNCNYDTIKNLLTRNGNVDEKDLLKMNDTMFKKLTICLELALKDSLDAKSGKIDENKLKTRFIGYKIYIINKGCSLKNIEAIRKNIDQFENSDLIDFIKLKSPDLQGKNIDEISVDDLVKFFKKSLLESGKSDKKRDPKAVMDFFLMTLSKCDDKEKAKIFHAFAKLIKDEDIQSEKIIQEAYKNLVTQFKDMKELSAFINKIGPEILKALGFSQETIQILNFQSIENLNADQVGAILDQILEVFKQIDEADLPFLKEALAAVDNGNIEQLSDKHKEVLEKYLPILRTTINVIAATANRPELKEQLGERYAKLFEILESKKFDEINLSEFIFKQIENLYDQNPELFNNIPKNKFIEKINAVSDNEFSKAIGDTNPNNLYTGDNNLYMGEPGYGFSQTSSDIVREANDNKRLLEEKCGINPNNSYTFNKTVTSPIENYKSYNNLTAQEIFEGLRDNKIKMYDVLENYSNLSKTGKDFINCYIEKQPIGIQNYILCGMGNRDVVNVIKHTNISPEELKGVALDYNSKKELERMEEQQIRL